MSEERVTAQLRRAVVARDNGRCHYCQSQAKYSVSSFVVEHVTPRSKGGTTSLENLVLACSGCNGHKYNKQDGFDSITGKRVSLYHPLKQRWEDHFAWNQDCSEIIPLTQTGRVTVAELQLNRPELINLRRVLYQVGEHPP